MNDRCGKGYRKMFRMWIKLIKDNHLIKDMVVCDETNNSLSAVANNRIHVDVAFKHNENEPFVYMHAYTPGNQQI